MTGSLLSVARKLATKRGGRCLSDRYRKGAELRWECARGHVWEAIPKLVMQGAWCFKCALRDGQDAMLVYWRGMAAARGGRCLSVACGKVSEPLEWECVHGHRWKARPGHMRTMGSWCPHCARKARLDMGAMHQTAAERGGKCLSDQYDGGHAKLRWQCEKGHEWESTPAKIRYGRWCPHKDCRYRQSAEKLRGDIDELRMIAEVRGGRLLSRTYINRSSPLKWRCAKGHTWMACASNVKFGLTWCPSCPRSANDKAAFKERMAAKGVRVGLR